MIFSLYESVRSSRPIVCTHEVYLKYALSDTVRQLCKQIAAEEDVDKRGELKKGLPIITWQASFEGRRLASEARPSGLFMLDIDHVEVPFELYSKQICNKIDALGIVFVGMTASQHGIRIVAKCRPEFKTIEECQRWLAAELGVEFDGVCKDFARSSFLVTDDYTYFMDGRMFSEEPQEGTVYEVGAKAEREPTATLSLKDAETVVPAALVKPQEEPTYKGIKYSQIAKEWLERNGGEPEKGERNAKLYKLATRLKYIADFDEDMLLSIMPTYGLPASEMKQLVHSAIGGTRATEMPKDLRDVITNIGKRMELVGEAEEYDEITTDASRLPALPPIIRQMTETAPDDFKPAVVLCQLPILGALGSKLRARYLDGRMHSPSFQVSLEAPQASGKSFMTRLVEYELGQMIEHDEEQREKEREYDAKVKEIKMLNTKVTQANKDEILGKRPQSLIRYCSPKMSITKLLMRMNDAKGLHLFAVAPEIDTVTKAFKSGFANYSDLLRNAFDNDSYGQDFASENSFSGIVPVYYNTLFSGTPKAMRRFYPDVEDGLVSRVCFVTLPDQFGKPMPVWKELTWEQKAIVDPALVRLNDISIQGDEVQDEHEMKLDWLNAELDRWLKVQQAEAVKNDDRTRDVFCRRAAVVGFRAGMLAYFLYGEKRTPTIMRNVKGFAVWVANMMLNQHLLRFNVNTTYSNVNRWETLFEAMPDEFTREELEMKATAEGVDTPVKMIISKWRLLGCITSTEQGKAKNGSKISIKFKKTKV